MARAKSKEADVSWVNLAALVLLHKTLVRDGEVHLYPEDFDAAEAAQSGTDYVQIHPGERAGEVVLSQIKLRADA